MRVITIIEIKDISGAHEPDVEALMSQVAAAATMGAVAGIGGGPVMMLIFAGYGAAMAGGTHMLYDAMMIHNGR